MSKVSELLDTARKQNLSQNIDYLLVKISAAYKEEKAQYVSMLEKWIKEYGDVPQKSKRISTLLKESKYGIRKNKSS